MANARARAITQERREAGELSIVVDWTRPIQWLSSSNRRRVVSWLVKSPPLGASSSPWRVSETAHELEKKDNSANDEEVMMDIPENDIINAYL